MEKTMCLFTKRIRNPKYLPNQKNGYNPPKCPHPALMYIEVKCGICNDCRKEKRRNWSTRIKEQLRETPNAVFFTGTFAPDRLHELQTKYDTKDKNTIAKKELRLFLERIRKETGKSVTHWVVTELGEDNGRIHIHGIFFSNSMSVYKLRGLLWRKWTAGYKFYGKYCNARTANYITKYMLKANSMDAKFRPIVLATKGIGKRYFIDEYNRKRHQYVPKTPLFSTIESYRNEYGQNVALPTYYRRKLWTDQEREYLMIEKYEDGTIWVKGSKYPNKTPEEQQHVFLVIQAAKTEHWKKHHESEEIIEEIRKERREIRKHKHVIEAKNGKLRERVLKREKTLKTIPYF